MVRGPRIVNFVPASPHLMSTTTSRTPSPVSLEAPAVAATPSPPFRFAYTRRTTNYDDSCVLETGDSYYTVLGVDPTAQRDHLASVYASTRHKAERLKPDIRDLYEEMHDVLLNYRREYNAYLNAVSHIERLAVRACTQPIEPLSQESAHLVALQSLLANIQSIIYQRATATRRDVPHFRRLVSKALKSVAELGDSQSERCSRSSGSGNGGR
jgi:hypothetical protein